MPLKNLGVEVVCLRHVEVRHDILVGLVLEHASLKADVVEVLVILLVFEVIYYRQLWRIVLEENLHRHRWHKGTGH